jgi:hypothetical protein
MMTTTLTTAPVTKATHLQDVPPSVPKKTDTATAAKPRKKRKYKPKPKGLKFDSHINVTDTAINGALSAAEYKQWESRPTHKPSLHEQQIPYVHLQRAIPAQPHQAMQNDRL